MSEHAALPGARRGGVHLVYAMQALAIVCGVLGSGTITGRFLFGLPSVVAVIIAYSLRGLERGNYLATHLRWQIRTFWLALASVVALFLVSALLTLVVIGIFLPQPGLVLIGLWVTWRVLRGWLALREHQPAPAMREPD